MLEKLARQTAIYGISTIVVRFLNYLLTPYYTRVFGQETYGIVVDVYALIPFVLVLLTMGMESGYFRFATRAELAGGDAAAGKRRLFATAWTATSLAAALFFLLVALYYRPISVSMGAAYAAHPEYLLWVAGIVLFDVMSIVPFCRLREQGRAMDYVMLKAAGVGINVALAFGFGAAGLFATPFGVGWVLVANFAASAVTWLLLLPGSLRGRGLRFDGRLLRTMLIYSLPLLLSGIAGTANEYIDRQMIKYLAPTDAMAQLGIYGAITKIAVVMILFTQMYRLAAEPFFLSNFKKDDFQGMNAAALKYYLMVSMLIFLGIGLYRDLFSLIVGRSFREGAYILPVVLGANVLSGIWLNLSFWYKREERTGMALVVTGSGLIVSVGANIWLVPRWGYYGAAWARFIGEAAMVAVSFYLNRRFYRTPYDLRRMVEYAVTALVLFFGAERLGALLPVPAAYLLYAFVLAGYAFYLVQREKIDVRAMMQAILKR